VHPLHEGGMKRSTFSCFEMIVDSNDAG